MSDTQIPQLSSFMTEIRNRNVFRSNLYYVQLLLPANISQSFRGTAELASMWCSSAHTPQSTIFTDDSYLEAGTRRKYAYDHDWQNLVLNFYVDQDFDTKKLFDEWRSKIVPIRRQFNYPDDYTASYLQLYLINQEGNLVYKYEFSNIYPKDVYAIELNYMQQGSPATFSVEFVYESATASAYSGNLADFSTKYNEVGKLAPVQSSNVEINPRNRR
jgi:hypothetical protein